MVVVVVEVVEVEVVVVLQVSPGNWEQMPLLQNRNIPWHLRSRPTLLDKQFNVWEQLRQVRPLCQSIFFI